MEPSGLPSEMSKYELIKEIGNGSFGQVFQAKDTTTGDIVAIKKISWPKQIDKQKKIMTELEILESCDSPYIVKCFGSYQTDDYLYIVLEYCNEGDLSAYIAERGALTEVEAIEFLCQILNAFQVLIDKRIIHRDLKLENILKHEGKIKVADFGLSKILESDPMTSTFAGTIMNMAPEMLISHVYNNKVDIWALGIIFYQFLFGSHPFLADSIPELRQKHTKGAEIPPDTKVSRESIELINRMLAQDPYKRASWDELFETLLAISQNLSNGKSTSSVPTEGLLSESIDFLKSLFGQGGGAEFSGDYSRKVLGIELYKIFEQAGISPETLVVSDMQRELQNISVSQLKDQKEVQNDWIVLTKEGIFTEAHYVMIKEAVDMILAERNRCVSLLKLYEDAKHFEIDLFEYAAFIYLKESFDGLSSLYQDIKSAKGLFDPETWRLLMSTILFENVMSGIRSDLGVLQEIFVPQEDSLRKLKKFDGRVAAEFIIVLNKPLKESLNERNVIKKLYSDGIVEEMNKIRPTPMDLFFHYNSVQNDYEATMKRKASDERAIISVYLWQLS